MIQVDDLSVAFQGVPLFEGASFTLQDGERCGLVGRNGSGKSTLFRVLIRKEKEDRGTIAVSKNYRIGTLDQHIVFTQPTVIEEAAMGLRPEDRDHLYKVEKILFGLGFSEADLDRNPSDFSGGFQLRLHLTKVLCSEPDCLLLDEPTNYLDILSIRWLQKFLRAWKGEFILISHDREFMDSVTTHTMGIHRHKVRKVKGGTVEFYQQILQQEEIHERTRQNLEKKKAHAQAFVDRFGAKASKAGQAQSKAKMIARIPTLERLKEIYHLDFHFNEASFPGKKMLEAEGVDFSYPGMQGEPLIKDLSLFMEKGQRIGIIGKNGRGKSTILKLLAGELSPNSGTIECSENLQVGYFGQTNIDRLHPKQTAEEEISSANSALNYTEVKAICGLMMFGGDLAKKTTSVLSGGEKSRVLLGKIVATPCNLLLLDEPTHHLDMESIEALIDAMEDFEGTVVMVTHSELILKRLALDQLIVCHEEGQEFFLGNYEEFLEKRGWEEEREGKPKKKGSDLKDEKQRRAELIAARSKALKPIDQEIAKKELRIAQLEKNQQASEALLAHATDPRIIQEQSKAVGLCRKELDLLYEDLENQLQKRDLLNAELSKGID